MPTPFTKMRAVGRAYHFAIDARQLGCVCKLVYGVDLLYCKKGTMLNILLARCLIEGRCAMC